MVANRTDADDIGGSAAQTRQSLVLAALRLFGQKGFDGTSTREIAAQAKANIGSIAYHFSGKEGLRLAAADHIVRTLQAVSDSAGNRAFAETQEEAERELVAVLDTMLTFLLVRPESGEIVQFVLRELSSPTEALDRIYDGIFEPIHKRLCRVWETATGEAAESDRVKLTVFTMIGQVIYFRIGREAVLRRMGWQTITSAEARAIVDVATRNLRVVLDANRRGS